MTQFETPKDREKCVKSVPRKLMSVLRSQPEIANLANINSKLVVLVAGLEPAQPVRNPRILSSAVTEFSADIDVDNFLDQSLQPLENSSSRADKAPLQLAQSWCLITKQKTPKACASVPILCHSENSPRPVSTTLNPNFRGGSYGQN